MLEGTDPPAALLGKARGLDLVATGKATKEVAAVEAALVERRVVPPESTVLNSVVDEVAVSVVGAVASGAMLLIPPHSRSLLLLCS